MKAVASMRRKGYDIKGETYKRVPRGYEAENPTAERLLKHSALWIGEDHDHSSGLHTSAFLGLAVREWRKMAPLHRWLVDTLQ